MGFEMAAFGMAVFEIAFISLDCESRLHLERWQNSGVYERGSAFNCSQF
jgi:hypothetical protein